MAGCARSRMSSLRGKRRDLARSDVTTWFVTDRMSVSEIATKLGRRPSVIRRLLDEAGVRGTDRHCIGLSELETAESLARRYEAGASISELVRQTGMDKRVIRGFLVQAGVDLPVAHSVTGEETTRIVARYRAGESIRALAASIGCSYGTIRATLQTARVELRPRGSVPVEPPPIPSVSVLASSQYGQNGISNVHED